MSLKIDGSIKYKGCFKPNEQLRKDEEWHKDFSFNIVKIALSEYFINNVPIEQTIHNHQNIYDFCGRQKFKGDSQGETHEIEYDYTNNPYTKITKQQKNVRYYISNRGCVFVKKYSKGTTELINKGFKVTIFNTYIEKPIKDYDIDMSFYIKECYKIIDIIKPKQTTMF